MGFIQRFRQTQPDRTATFDEWLTIHPLAAVAITVLLIGAAVLASLQAQAPER